MYGMAKDEAEKRAAQLNSERIGETALSGYGKIARRYTVQPHAWECDGTPRLWGVVERWTYADRPDLGEMGGAFVWFHA
jgi:hypothetical protein